MILSVRMWLAIVNSAGEQGCQLPDSSLRSQTFCYTADCSTTFYIYWKPKPFCTSHHKTTSKHFRIQEFWLHFAKKFCDFRQNGKAPPPSWLLCLGRPMACGNSCVKHFAKFPDFFETQCCQPWQEVTIANLTLLADYIETCRYIFIILIMMRYAAMTCGDIHFRS